MILCISCHTTEYTTELVMDWIEYMGGTCKRVNGIDILEKTKFSINISSEKELEIATDNQMQDFEVGWFRKWMGQPLNDIEKSDCKNYNELHVSNFKRSEFSAAGAALFTALADKSWLDLPPAHRSYPSKLQQLKIAQVIGLKIPSTILTNNKNDLVTYISRNHISSLIIKPLKEVQPIIDESGDLFTPYTFNVTEYLDLLPEFFFPSQFQENITKEYEVRVFYLNKVCYSMAIFSASDDQTNADFRNYNWKKPNRTVPLTLPKEIEQKTILLMEQSGLTTGSLDFIVNENNEYVFLEINPTGQFGMVSFPCNYHLEKEVAESLIKQQHHEKRHIPASN